VLAGEVQAATTAVLLVLLKTMVIAGVLGALGAWLLVLLLDRNWVPDFLESPLALTVVVAAFATSNVLQSESGLLTATLMGVALANQGTVNIKHILEFKENLRVLLISGLFILLAARLQLSDLRQLGPPHLAFLGALILIVRPVAVVLSTLGSELTWRERALISWVAPRGIVAAAVSSIFALELAEAGYAGADQLVSITFMVIIGTVMVYGLTSGPLARGLGVAMTDPQGVLFLGAHPWVREIASELRNEGIPVRLVDTNYANISEARMAGLPVYYGSALTEGALDNIELEGIGRLLAVTSNDEVNSLAALHFSEIFGDDKVFQLAPEQLTATTRHVVSRHLRGRFLFDRDATYWYLTARFDAGADVKTTNLTDEFDYQKFKDRYRKAIPLFLIGDNGKLTVFTVIDPPEPGPGQRVTAVVDPLGEAPESTASD
jgi:hypothetical protein